MSKLEETLPPLEILVHYHPEKYNYKSSARSIKEKLENAYKKCGRGPIAKQRLELSYNPPSGYLTLKVSPDNFLKLNLTELIKIIKSNPRDPVSCDCLVKREVDLKKAELKIIIFSNLKERVYGLPEQDKKKKFLKITYPADATTKGSFFIRPQHILRLQKGIEKYHKTST